MEKSPSLPEKIELLKIVLNSAEKEGDRMWSRNAWMLTANGGLVALMAIRLEAIPILAIIVSVLGVALTVMWYFIAVLSYYYERRWFADAQAIIESDETLKDYIRARGANSRVPRPISQTGTTFVKGLVLAFGIAWIAILVLSIFTVLTK